MDINGIIIGGEVLSLLAMIVIFLKVGILQPECFSLSDAYFTISPILLVKISEFIKVIKERWVKKKKGGKEKNLV